MNDRGRQRCKISHCSGGQHALNAFSLFLIRNTTARLQRANSTPARIQLHRQGNKLEKGPKAEQNSSGKHELLHTQSVPGNNGRNRKACAQICNGNSSLS